MANKTRSLSLSCSQAFSSRTHSLHRNVNRDNKLNCSSCPFHVKYCATFRIVFVPEDLQVAYSRRRHHRLCKPKTAHSSFPVCLILREKLKPREQFKIKMYFRLFLVSDIAFKCISVESIGKYQR